jgi:neutral ceramidase
MGTGLRKMGLLKAAAGQVDLAVHPGMWMTGYARRIVPARGTHDAPMARAVLLDDGTTTLVIVSCDLLGFAAQTVATMRRRLASLTSIPAGHVMICCTHTHSGPASMPMRGVLGHVDDAWLEQAQDKIVDLVAGLSGRMAPALVAFARSSAPGIGFNRQDAAHPIDEELCAIAIDAPSGASIATILNYATHAVVLGPDNLDFSADWPGAAAAAIAGRRGGIGLVLQGACGDVDPAIQHVRGWGNGTFEDVHAIGDRLASLAGDVLAAAPRRSDVTLGVASGVVPVLLDPPPSPAQIATLVRDWEETRAATNDPVQRAQAGAMLDWAAELYRAMESNTVPAAVQTEIFSAAINDIRLVGVPFEPYSDIALAVKLNLFPLHTVFAGYANGLYGYCPTCWAKAAGGYGADAAYCWFGGALSALGYGADETLIAQATMLAQSLGR